MAGRALEKLRAANPQDWDVVETRRKVVRGLAAEGEDPFLDKLQESGRLKVVDRKQVRSVPKRGVPTAAQLELEAVPGTDYVLMARHESGAITFHFPVQVEHRSGRRGAAMSTTIRFTIPFPEALPGAVQRRGIIGRVIHAVVMKVVGKLADKAIAVAARLAETAAWKLKGLEEGWKLVTPQALQSGSLPKVKIAEAVSSEKKNLLFLHGTFSHTSAAFAALSTTRSSNGKTFFEALQEDYGNRIFAFDHFTVSRSPEENVRAMLAELPSGPYPFDVVTHSRGGLVLRTVVEDPKVLGPLASRFSLGRCVLVASPNEGTPLASPSRFDQYVTWTANLIDMFPENPFTIAAHFIGEALSWLARGVRVDMSGLAAMNNQGEVIRQLQAPPGPPAKSYSALVANYEPDQGVLRRMIDAGVDIFFNTANDLVVPTEGGWRVDPGGAPAIAGDQIGCYGRGGNLPDPSDGQVIHTSFFSRGTTVSFLTNALQGLAQGLNLLDPRSFLPFRGQRGLSAAPLAPIPATVPEASQGLQGPDRAPTRPAIIASGLCSDEVFYLSVLEDYRKDGGVTLLANFRNARVIERLRTRGGNSGQRFRRIIDYQRSIRDFLNGVPGVTELPGEEDLIRMGRDLFEILFQGRVRRLYDAARSFQPGGRLNLVFTSMISWLADLPWEFAYDIERRNFLATSEVNFTRNVQTTIPADRIEGRSQLRILVVVAQPLGLAHLSVDEETQVIKSGFRRLIDNGLATVDVLLDATPALLHQTLEVIDPADQRVTKGGPKPYDIVHFIGHGGYDERKKIGCLVFENDEEGMQTLDSQIVQQIMCRRDIRLVFLNACETGTGGPVDFTRGVAPALVAGGVPAVVANQFSVLDVSATAFARHFYWALAQGRTVGDAAREARVAVNYSISGEAIDWAIPVVFARNPADRLATVKGDAAAEVAKQHQIQLVTSRMQRRAFHRPVSRGNTIGLWDVHHNIPNLDKIAETLNRCQTDYFFKAVSITAPIGTWRRERSEGVAYLKPQQIVERLRQKPKELGIDRLIAITNFPLRDNRTVLYAWDEDPEHEISIFSTYEMLDQISPPLSIERMVANAVAGFISKLPPHEKGPKNCPSFYNTDCDIRYIAGPLELCRECRKDIKNKKLRATVEKLLAAYP